MRGGAADGGREAANGFECRESREGVLEASLGSGTGAQGRGTTACPHLGKLRAAEVRRCGEESQGAVGLEDRGLGSRAVYFLEVRGGDEC